MASELSRVGMVAAVMKQQHDHHCLLTFEGFNWRIGVCAKNRIMVYRSTQYPEMVGRWIVATINTERVDWESYCNTAAAWDVARERA